MRWLLVIAFVVLAMGLGFALASRLGPRVGVNMSDLTPAKKRRLVLLLVLAAVPGLVVAWALSTGHTALGIGLLLAVAFLPEVVLIPLRIRRSSRAAARSRARRRNP
jgi:Zn-dependent protease with chaperone function